MPGLDAQGQPIRSCTEPKPRVTISITSNRTARGSHGRATRVEDMALTPAQHSEGSLPSIDSRRRCLAIRDDLIRAGLYPTEPTAQTNGPAGFRIAPDPVSLSVADFTFIQHLGQTLLSFYRALNRLYLDSARGTQPAWVASYLDQGKPESLIAYGRMNRFRNQLPAVIRPDIIPTTDGMVITELDSVPGGIGLTACLAGAYDAHRSASSSAARSSAPVGRDGMIQPFAAMLRSQQGDHLGCIAIVVSEEAKEYRPEMQWMAERLREIGCEAYCTEPKAVRFSEEGLSLDGPSGPRPIGLIYRFYELFDLKNIPKSELLMYAVKKETVAVTPPYKPALEEKLAFGLFHHPELDRFWKNALDRDAYTTLHRLLPRTWILDPRPIPPSAVIPNLQMGGQPLSDFRRLAAGTQKERHLVIKPSGFSELAWGSRGVSIGHDLPQAEWALALEQALERFPTTPSVLQEFHKGRQFECRYYDVATDQIATMSARARLSPYYFVVGEKAELGGVLATLCSAEKKIIHGMVDAVMAPCAVEA